MSKALIIAGILAIASALISIRLAQQKDHQLSMEEVATFNTWVVRNSKQYSTPSEKTYRTRIVLQNKQLVDLHNADPKKAYSMALNHLADLTEEEFRSKYLSSKPFENENVAKATEAVSEPNLKQQSNFDLLNYLQQQIIYPNNECNDNYAWISAISMNANYYIQRQRPIQYQFSPQTYIDCSANFGNTGCGGGNTVNSYTYSVNYGIDTLADYRYIGRQQACRAATGFFKNAGHRVVTSLSNTELYQTLATMKYVITAYVDLSQARFYNGGVFQGPCSSDPNHGVLLVGAGTDPLRNLPYWLIMTSLGPLWGENGKMRLARFAVDGQLPFSSCGLNRYAAFPWFN